MNRIPRISGKGRTWLAAHLNHLWEHAKIRPEWLDQSPSALQNSWQELNRLSDVPETFARQELLLSALHRRAADTMARDMHWLAERDFPAPPAPSHWIQVASDRRTLWSLHEQAASQLKLLLASSIPTRSRASIYGGVKSPSSIARRVKAFEKGKEELDLWDLVRFRIVTATLEDLCAISEVLTRSFGMNMVRVRNYYARPRLGWADPYRAVHFEFELGCQPGRLVELQVVTKRRQLVGLLDHAHVHLQKLHFIGREHARWLRDLSYAANVLDCQALARGPSAKFARKD